MRQVFSSERLETVEGVAQMLRDKGIETVVRHGRGYKGNRRQTFSYRTEAVQSPEVWVLNNDDKSAARQILFDAGLVDSTRDNDSYLSDVYRRDEQRARKRQKGLTFRLVALAILAVAAGGMFLWRAQSAGNPTDVALSGPFDASTSRAIPISLMTPALQQGIDVGTMPVLCLSVAGSKPANALMQRLSGNGKRILPFNHCTRDGNPDTGSHTADGTPAEFVDIAGFKATSPTQGTIEINTFHHNQWGHYRTYAVELVDGHWTVRKLVRHVAL